VGMRVATSGRPEARYVKILKGVFWPLARGEARTSRGRGTPAAPRGPLAGEDGALADASGPRLGLHPRDVVGSAAHEEKLDVGHEREGVEEKLHALIGLEVARVETTGHGPSDSSRRSALTASGDGAASGSTSGGFLDWKTALGGPGLTPAVSSRRR